MSTFELTAPPPGSEREPPLFQGGFAAAVLVNNAQWFIRIRWLAVGVLAFTAVAGNLIPGIIRELGFAPPLKWPWLLAGVLAAANAGFAALARKLTADSPLRRAEGNIWLQIIVDLAVVTILVHIVGSTTTFISFIYLLHVVLACIFFSIKKSLLVTLLAANSYLFCVILEISGVWPAAGILLQAGYPREPLTLNTTFAVSAVLIWLVVWYLVSHLAETLRQRDQEFISANEALIRANQEKNQQVLRTTHDLKAPFSGIESNIQILRLQHWETMPEAVRAILQNIELRAQVLRERIRDIFVLGELRSQATPEPQPGPVNIQAVLKAVQEDLAEKAQSRQITLQINVPAITVRGSVKPLAILFSNVIANAIIYSREGGEVQVAAREDAATVAIAVVDHGIGIRADALPHIFEEYFRTNEAARFNNLSTGLGLAIVKEVAHKLGLGLKVSSEPGRGTTFEVFLPKTGAPAETEPAERSNAHGKNQDN